MTNGIDNRDAHMRCLACGRIDEPGRRSTGRGAVALGLWAAAGLASVIAYALGILWVQAIFAALLLAALLYTLWYFFRREEACRHCGATSLEPHGAAPG